MLDRRSVLKIGAATVTGALVKIPVSARNQPLTREHPAFPRAVFDERFAECRGFAAELHSAGVFLSAIRGDVARLWYDDLRTHLRETRLPAAGLTDRPALFCLEELARDVGMRVIFRADHIIDQNGHIQHTAVGPALFCLEELARDVGMRVIFRADHIIDQNGHIQHTAVGPASLVAVAGNLPKQAGFGRAMAALLSKFDFTEACHTSAQKRTGPFSPENKTALVSWLIA